jgi:hypothetical protein
VSDAETALRLAGAASAWKQPCRVVATSNVATTGLQTIDGVVLATGDRVLLTEQTDETENGPWVASTGRWWRAEDWGTDAFAKLGTTITVVAGTTYALSQWTLSSPTTGAIVIGATELTFTRSDVAHGNLAGGSLHALAVANGAAGFMSGTDKARIDDFNAKLNATYSQASDPNLPTSLIDQLTVSIIRALDAQTAEDQPDTFIFSGGRPHSSLIGIDTYHTAQHHGGIGGTALNGEGGQLNFFGGEYRVPGCPPVLCGEIGYTWQFDYDIDVVSGLPRTPYALRLHSGVNPNTNARTRLVLQGYDDATLESEFGNIVMSIRSGQRIARALPTSVASNGMTVYDVSAAVTHTGATVTTITIPNFLPLAKLANCELTVVSKSTDHDSRERWKVTFSWFATVVALVENFASVGGYPSPTGRVSVTDNGVDLMVVITGLADGKTRNTTLHLEVELQA